MNEILLGFVCARFRRTCQAHAALIWLRWPPPTYYGVCYTTPRSLCSIELLSARSFWMLWSLEAPHSLQLQYHALQATALLGLNKGQDRLPTGESVLLLVAVHKGLVCLF